MDGIRRVVWPAIVCLAAGTVVPGCSQVAVFPAPMAWLRPIADRLGGPGWSASTSAVLNGLGLEDLARHHPRDAFAFLEQRADPQQPDSERLLALAELADQIGRTAALPASAEAIRWSRDAAVYAVFCLAQPGETPNRALTWCAARAVHNRAVSRCLGLARTRTAPDRGTWPTRLAEAGIVPAATVPEWTVLGFDTLQATEDFTVAGPGPFGRRPGLGVPLIVHRNLAGAELTGWKPTVPARRRSPRPP